MKDAENEQAGEDRPVTGWYKIHALALCVLALVGVVIFVGPYVERLFVQGCGQSVPQQVVVSPWGRPPVASCGGQQVVCAMPPTFEELSKAFVRLGRVGRVGRVGRGDNKRTTARIAHSGATRRLWPRGGVGAARGRSGAT